MDSKHVNIQMESKAPKVKVLSEAEKKQEKKRILKITIGYICLILLVLSVVSVIVYFKLYEYPTIASRNGNAD
jgi:hypothetical protein